MILRTRLPFLCKHGYNRRRQRQIRRQQLLNNHSSNHDVRYNDFAK